MQDCHINIGEKQLTQPATCKCVIEYEFDSEKEEANVELLQK